MLSIDLGEIKLPSYAVEGNVKKYALKYLALCPKTYQYNMMEKYVRDNFNIKTNLYSICYYIIARAKISKAGDEYKVILYPRDEMLFRTITYGNRSIAGIPILLDALKIMKR